MDARALAHLGGHHGLITTAVSLGLGVSRHQIATMVERNELIRVHHGVYRHAAAPVTIEQRVHAALLAVGAGGVLSHRAAIAWWGVRNFECHLVELLHRSRSLPLRAGVVVHRCSGLSDVDVRVHRGLRVTAPARSLVDAASVLPPELVARWAQEWMADRLVRPGDLEAAVARAGNHRGAHRLRPQLATTVPEADSAAEAQLGRALLRAGLSPELHVLVTTSAGYTFELDWAFSAARLGLEMDGYGVHLRSASRFDSDRFRRNELEIDGWKILNFTTRQLRTPDRVVDQVRRALARSDHLG